MISKSPIVSLESDAKYKLFPDRVINAPPFGDTSSGLKESIVDLTSIATNAGSYNAYPKDWIET